ncbi:hypothetical protein GCM10027073_22070 [Streptomyces chlorus]|uniref:Lipoprotein n=1 Tax=Streptomyces chlorus TaxID=887452 RepID=A0ABW1E491_9ACTN
MAAVLVHHTSPVAGLPAPTPHGYLPVFAMACAIALAACATAPAMPRDPDGAGTRRAFGRGGKAGGDRAREGA